MNKKGKEGGSTWFNRRQTEIPLFKINKKKKKKSRQGESVGTLGESSRGSGHFAARTGDPPGRTFGEGPGELSTIKVFIFRVCASRCLGLGTGFIRTPSSGAAHPEGFG